MSFLQIITFTTDRLRRVPRPRATVGPRLRGQADERRGTAVRRPRPAGSLRGPGLVRLLRVGDGELPAPRDRLLRPGGDGPGRPETSPSTTSSPRRRSGTTARTGCAARWRPPRPPTTPSPTTSTSTCWCRTAGCATRGSPASSEALRDEAPGRDIELWNAHATFDGFVVEYAYRTHGTPSWRRASCWSPSATGGSQRLAITCAGNWSAETEARVVEETGALGPRVREAVR